MSIDVSEHSMNNRQFLAESSSSLNHDDENVARIVIHLEVPPPPPPPSEYRESRANLSNSAIGAMKRDLHNSPGKSRIGGESVFDSNYSTPPPNKPVLQGGTDSSRTIDSAVSMLSDLRHGDSFSELDSMPPTTPTSESSPHSFGRITPTVTVTTRAESIMDRARPLTVNSYRFLKTIGKGAYAEVKLATKVDDQNPRDGDTGDRYAVKIIKKNFLSQKRTAKYKVRGSLTPGNSPLVNSPHQIDDKVVPEEVLQEINIMKHMSHPQLVKLHEIIDDDSCKYLYLVMEYVEAGPIMTFDQASQRFVCKLTNGVLLESMACRAFRELMSALAYLHMNHIAHRDLKPDNLLIDFNGKLKVTDFGVSSHFSDEKRKAAINLRHLPRSKSRGIVAKTEGTFPFYSPEMCQEYSQSYSAYMSDVWAASVCLWIFVFGKLPFYHPDVVKLFAMIRIEEPTMPHRLSPELEDLFKYLLKKKVGKRLSIADIQHHCWLNNVPLWKMRERQQQRCAAANPPPTQTRSDRSIMSSESTALSMASVVSTDRSTSPLPAEDLTLALSPNIKLQIMRWKEAALATCASRKNKLLRSSNADFSAMVRKSLLALKGTRASDSGSSADENAEMLSFSHDEGNAHSDDDDDPLARVVSFDEISPTTLREMREYEKKHMANKVVTMLTCDEDYDSSPRPSDASETSSPHAATTKKPLRTGRKSSIMGLGGIVPLSPVREGSDEKSLRQSQSQSSSSCTESPSITSSGGQVAKKPLRSGRKKVSITATGDLAPSQVAVGSTILVSSDSTTSAQSSISSIAKLDEIMRKLEESERNGVFSEEEDRHVDDTHVTSISSCGCIVM